ncbi:MAG: 16S rRNA (cytosine(967)-C(5))-methyltransferase RsmB [Desulfobacterales bacterium]|nr:16S rRNA (cytosine(967)-C(5))-methyltransferase RsmB [Desulfobacterales bacterium]
MNPTPRELAIDILCQWERDNLPIDQILEVRRRREEMADPRDWQLLFALVHGVIRWRGYLDWVLGRFSRHPLNRMKPRTRQALRVGTLQLLFMDRIPPAAAINETVAALKQSRQPGWLTGFVNGVLRTIARRQPDLPRPQDQDSDLPETARFSHPQWLVDRWKKRYGQEGCGAICAADNSPAILCLRVNSRAISRPALQEMFAAAGIEARPGLFSPEALLLDDFQGAITGLPGYVQGFFQVQGEAAQMAGRLLLPLQPDNSYLDGCAGPGGKTSHLAQELPIGAKLLAVEPNRLRIQRLRDNLARLQLTDRVRIIEDILENINGTFNGIILDAPCSGLGVISRHPDIRWNRTAADLGRYQKKQLALLNTAVPLLARAGILVYVTCSTEPEENEMVIEKFLAAHSEFTLENAQDFLPEQLVDQDGFFRTLPGQHGMDGFFGARLRKER